MKIKDGVKGERVKGESKGHNRNVKKELRFVCVNDKRVKGNIQGNVKQSSKL